MMRGGEFRKYRKAAGLTLKDIAKIIGTTHQYIGVCERNSDKPVPFRPECWQPLAEALGISITEFWAPVGNIPSSELPSLLQKYNRLMMKYGNDTILERHIKEVEDLKRVSEVRKE